MAKRETVIGKEIAILEKALSTAPEKVKIKLKSKIARLKKEAKGIPMSAKQLANNVLRQKQKLKELSKTDFNNLIRQLSKKPEYAFLKSMTKDEIIRDINRKAKPAGWRFKGRGDYRNPTKRDIANRGTNGVYWEARRERSDVSQAAQLKKGGKVPTYYEVGADFGEDIGTQTIETFDTKKEALEYKKKVEKGQVKDKYNEWPGKASDIKSVFVDSVTSDYLNEMAKGGEMEQGYNDRMDESLGMRHRGSKSQSLKDRRDEAKGMNKAMGDRAYQSVGTMDKMDKGGYIRIKEILGEDTPWLADIEDDTPHEDEDGLRYVWYDGDQTTSNVTQVLKRFGLNKQKINDDLKRKGLKKEWVFDDGFAHLTVMFPDKKETGGEIEIEEPEIVRYYFEDDAYEYETGGGVKGKSEELEILKKLLIEDIASEKELLKDLIRKGERDDIMETRGMMGARKEVLRDIRNIEEGKYKKGGTYFADGGETEEPEIVRYYFEDDAYEYKNGGTMSDGKGMKFRLESANEDLKRVAKFVDSNPMVKKAMDKTVNGFNIDSALGDALVATDLSDDEVFEFKVNGKSFDEYGKGGNLKSVPGDNKGLSKLPKSVRNKMGYMEEGGEMEQGYNDRDDESLGMSHRGMKKQSYKSRRDESKGERKFMGKRAYRDDK